METTIDKLIYYYQQYLYHSAQLYKALDMKDDYIGAMMHYRIIQSIANSKYGK
jgi:hypothetical protein